MVASITSAFHIARTGLQVTEANLAVKSQNIASQGADGFKKQYLVATDLPYQDMGHVGSATSEAGTINPTGSQIGSGVQVAGIYRDYRPGTEIRTENALDVMIEGDGFFAVTLPSGETAYTRVGALQLDANNTLTMIKNGYPLTPGITLPAGTQEIAINAFGQVYVTVNGSTDQQLVGQLQTATFFNPSGLKAIGDSLFLQTSASGTANVGTPGSDNRGRIKQGAREGSNVNAVEEMTDLIKIEKIYEMLTKVLKTGDAMMEAANRVGR